MTSSGSGSNDLFNELGRQVGVLSSRAAAFPRRLDESLERLEQGDIQLQVRLGESDRQLRRIVDVQDALGKSVLLGFLAMSAALLGAGPRPLWALVPLTVILPVGSSWVRVQIKLRNARKAELLRSQITTKESAQQ